MVESIPIRPPGISIENRGGASRGITVLQVWKMHEQGT